MSCDGMDWETREVLTRVALAGQSLQSVGWPDEWERLILIRGWRKRHGGTTGQYVNDNLVERPFDYFLSDRAIHETRSP